MMRIFEIVGKAINKRGKIKIKLRNCKDFVITCLNIEIEYISLLEIYFLWLVVKK